MCVFNKNQVGKSNKNIYLRVTITNEKGKVEKYETKLEFTIDFSNNKIYYNDNFYLEEYNYEITGECEIVSN